MTKPWDVIVVGVGGMGSAALYHLARRGARVLGLEQYQLGHNRGSSHGKTRIIRKAYYEHPSYIPLLHSAYDNWHELEAECGQPLYQRTGLVLVGNETDGVIQGVREGAAVHNLKVESVSPSDFRKRFSGLILPAGAVALFEAEAGFLRVEDCVHAHAERAKRLGAEIREGVCIDGWKSDSDGVTVFTGGEAHRAGRLVLCAGAWSGTMLQWPAAPLEVRRKMMLWYEGYQDLHRVDRGFPTFLYSVNGRRFYGMPAIERQGMKVAEHTGGEVVHNPSELDRSLRVEDHEAVTAFLNGNLSGMSPTLRHHCACMYTMTPDENFIIDRHPMFDNVFLSAGFSGHGFKFAPVVGKILADLALDGRTDQPIEFLSAKRFITNNTR